MVQMLRVIGQESAHKQAWEAFLAGNGKKHETFAVFARRTGAEARTKPPTAVTENERRSTVESVKRKLGPLYRPPAPITA